MSNTRRTDTARPTRRGSGHSENKNQTPRSPRSVLPYRQVVAKLVAIRRLQAVNSPYFLNVSATEHPLPRRITAGTTVEDRDCRLLKINIARVGISAATDGGRRGRRK